MDRRPKKTFLQRRHTDGQKHMNRFSTSLIIREIQSKTTMRYHLTPVKVTIIKKNPQTKINAGEGGEGNLSILLVGM